MGSVSISSYICCLFMSCLCIVCILWQFSMLPSALLAVRYMLVADARCDQMAEAYSRAGLITALYVSMSVSFCLPHHVAVSVLKMFCRGLCVCTEMLWMGVLYVSFGSKVRPRIFGCISMGMRLVCFVQKLYVGMVVCVSWLHPCLCVWM